VQYLGGRKRGGLENYCTSIINHFRGGAIILEGKTVDDRCCATWRRRGAAASEGGGGGGVRRRRVALVTSTSRGCVQ